MRNTQRGAVAVGVAAVLALSGCSASDNGSAGGDGEVSGTVTMLYDSGYKAALEPVVKAFEEKYPDAKLDVTYGGSDILTVVSTQAQSGSLPDIFLTVPGPVGSSGFSVGTLGSQGYLADLSDTSWAADIPETWKGTVSVDDKVYAYPGTVQGLGGAYNLTKMKELGLEVPQTWSEVLDLCQAATDAGVYAYSQGLNDAAGPQMIYLALSATLVYGPEPSFPQDQAAGKATFQDSAWRDVFQKYVEMNDAGCFGEGALGRTRPQGTQEVAAGKALSIVDVGASLSGLQESAPDSEFAFAALPATDDAAETYFPAAPGYTIAVNADAKNLDAAKAFLDVLAESDNINTYAAGFASVPAIPNDDFKPPASLEAFNTAIADGQFTDYSNQGWPNPNVGETAQTEVQQVLLGKHTIDQALEAMQQAYDG